MGSLRGAALFVNPRPRPHRDGRMHWRKIAPGEHGLMDRGQLVATIEWDGSRGSWLVHAQDSPDSLDMPFVGYARSTKAAKRLAVDAVLGR